MQKRLLIATVAAAAFSLSTSPAFAEEGDYSAWRTFWNLVFPPRADRPVTSPERTGPYPLLSNPGNFSDGFKPGGYLLWQTVQLHPSTGAICGNGSPYKFFVNRVAHTRNTLIYFEAGGACWDYQSCTGQAGIRGARNPDGIPDNYMDLSNPAASLVSPFVFRLHPYTRTKIQDWNIVYVPYCTGDVYIGDKTAIYEDPMGQDAPIVWHHNGVRNIRAVVSWLRDNLPRPSQLLVSGCSAGGAGAITNYHPVRRDMAANRNYLVNDSGPIYPTEADGPLADNPSQPLHATIKAAWGLDAVVDYLQTDLTFFDFNDLGTINTALSYKYPGDRLGHTYFLLDQNYSAYSYERFFEDIFDERDQSIREQKITEKWLQDTGKLIAQLASLTNFGYYFPNFRDVNDSHCTTIIDFENGDIQELGLELGDFIDDVLEASGPVLESKETDTQADLNKPFNPIYALIEWLL